MTQALLQSKGFYIILACIIIASIYILYKKEKRNSLIAHAKKMLPRNPGNKISPQELIKSPPKNEKKEPYKPPSSSLKNALRAQLIKIDITLERLILYWVALFAMSFIVTWNQLAMPLSISLALSLLASVIILLALLKSMQARRIQKIRTDFPGVIDMLARRLKTGGNISQALLYISDESGSSMWRHEFKIVFMELEAGNSFANTLKRSQERVNIPEYRLFCSIMLMQKKLGGRLSEIISGLANMIRSKKVMEKKIRALSSQASGSANFISSLPIMGFLLMYINNPGIIDQILASRTGSKIFLIGCGLYLTGFILLRKLTNIKL